MFFARCVGIQERQSSDIEIYHCPNCQEEHGPLVRKFTLLQSCFVRSQLATVTATRLNLWSLLCEGGQATKQVLSVCSKEKEKFAQTGLFRIRWQNHKGTLFLVFCCYVGGKEAVLAPCSLTNNGTQAGEKDVFKWSSELSVPKGNKQSKKEVSTCQNLLCSCGDVVALFSCRQFKQEHMYLFAIWRTGPSLRKYFSWLKSGKNVDLQPQMTCGEMLLIFVLEENWTCLPHWGSFHNWQWISLPLFISLFAERMKYLWSGNAGTKSLLNFWKRLVSKSLFSSTVKMGWTWLCRLQTSQFKMLKTMLVSIDFVGRASESGFLCPVCCATDPSSPQLHCILGIPSPLLRIHSRDLPTRLHCLRTAFPMRPRTLVWSFRWFPCGHKCDVWGTHSYESQTVLSDHQMTDYETGCFLLA